jgi:hypothetical protein
MLYQLETPIGLLIIFLDLVVLGLLIKLFRQPRSVSVSWLVVLVLVILTLPLAGIKFLLSSSDMAASTPGLVVIKNPQHQINKLYFLRHYPQGLWQVQWVEYTLTSGKEMMLERESQDGLEVAYHHAGKWHYAPIRFDSTNLSEINFPRDFTAVDASGHIEAAVARHTFTEGSGWLSNLLTIGSIGLLGLVIYKRTSSEKRRT